MLDHKPLKNPLMGDRVGRERELQALVTRLAAAEDRDPVEVIMELSEWRGHSYLNPAAMPDDRLLHTLLSARKRLQGDTVDDHSGERLEMVRRVDARRELLRSLPRLQGETTREYRARIDAALEGKA